MRQQKLVERFLAEKSWQLSVQLTLCCSLSLALLVWLVGQSVPLNSFFLWLGVAVTFCLAWFSINLVSLFIIGPLSYAQGLRNGGPFVIGDHVEVLSGKYRGTESRIYDKGQHDSSRVWISPEAHDNYHDLYADHQLRRIEAM